MSVEQKSKFSALHWQWWRPRISENSKDGQKQRTIKKIELINNVFFTYAFMDPWDHIPCLAALLKNFRYMTEMRWFLWRADGASLRSSTYFQNRRGWTVLLPIIYRLKNSKWIGDCKTSMKFLQDIVNSYFSTDENCRYIKCLVLYYLLSNNFFQVFWC